MQRTTATSFFAAGYITLATLVTPALAGTPVHRISNTPTHRISSTPYVPPIQTGSSAAVPRAAVNIIAVPGYYSTPGYYYSPYGYNSRYRPARQSQVHYHNHYYDGYRGRRDFHSFTINGPIPPIETDHLTPVYAQAQPVEPTTMIRTDRHRRLIENLQRNATLERIAAAGELAEFPSMQSLAVLQDALVNDAVSDVRQAAAKSLGQIADHRSFIGLLRIVQYDSDEEVKSAADYALAEIRFASDPALIPEDFQLRPLNHGRIGLAAHLEVLRLGSFRQRQKAITELIHYRGTQSSAAIIDALINDPSKAVRATAARQLAVQADDLALPFLEWAALNDPENSVQRRARSAHRMIAARQQKNVIEQ